MKPKLVSLFSGCGGLDLGFKRAGFKTIWANENDPTITPTFKANFKNVFLDTRSITDVDLDSVPDCDGIIGGPPCQSWSVAGNQKGLNDPRGKLFETYIDFVATKRPKFFLAENVYGFLMKKHDNQHLLERFAELGYNVTCVPLTSKIYSVPQDRKRVFIVGYPVSYEEHFYPPQPEPMVTLRDAIWNLRKGAVRALKTNKTNPRAQNNHEYMVGKFSSHYMSRNRVRSWDETSFTIQASGRHAPCHPRAPKFEYVEKDKMKFATKDSIYRRLTIRECAAIQTFPDSFKFVYNNLSDGYKMIGNAVPVNMAYFIAKKIKEDLHRLSNLPASFGSKGEVKSFTLSNFLAKDLFG